MTFVAVCPPGKYKHLTGDEHCQPCPPHSKASDYGLAECRCNSGYYRSPKDLKSLPCTRKSHNYMFSLFFIKLLHNFKNVFFTFFVIKKIKVEWNDFTSLNLPQITSFLFNSLYSLLHTPSLRIKLLCKAYSLNPIVNPL